MRPETKNGCSGAGAILLHWNSSLMTSTLP